MLVHTLAALESLGSTSKDRANRLQVSLRTYFRYRDEAKKGRLTLPAEKALAHPRLCAALWADSYAGAINPDTDAGSVRLPDSPN
jgi:hypothetical protein